MKRRSVCWNGVLGEPLATSVEKALDVCEALSRQPRGASVGELARNLGLPSPTVHRLLAVLKRRGYVRQDEETQRYGLTLKMLDLSFQLLGRSELRLHAYPLLRDYALRSGQRTFLADSGGDEVTYIWASGPDEVAMRTVFGRPMPAHCKLYFSATQATRRLSCLRHEAAPPAGPPALLRLGPQGGEAAQRLCCTCAPVLDYTGREVARVGVFAHEPDDTGLVTTVQRDCRELASQVSRRLGHLPAAMEATA
jgi:DNA-binding IclR family transcriptional regulator